MGKSALSLPTKAWAEKINACLRKSAEGWIEAGHMLLNCKEQVPRGDFQRMVERELEIDKRTAERFMKIAGHPVLGNATNLSHLPSAYTTLYELTKLSEERLKEAMGSGEIHPRMRGDYVANLLERRPKIIDVTPEDITESADEVDAPADAAVPAMPGSAVATPDLSGEHAADDREDGGDSGHQSNLSQPVGPDFAACILGLAHLRGADAVLSRKRLPVSDEEFMATVEWLLEIESVIYDERKTAAAE